MDVNRPTSVHDDNNTEHPSRIPLLLTCFSFTGPTYLIITVDNICDIKYILLKKRTIPNLVLQQQITDQTLPSHLSLVYSKPAGLLSLSAHWPDLHLHHLHHVFSDPEEELPHDFVYEDTNLWEQPSCFANLKQ